MQIIKLLIEKKFNIKTQIETKFARSNLYSIEINLKTKFRIIRLIKYLSICITLLFNFILIKFENYRPNKHIEFKIIEFYLYFFFAFQNAYHTVC